MTKDRTFAAEGLRPAAKVTICAECDESYPPGDIPRRACRMVQALRPRRRERSDVDRASLRANSLPTGISQGYHRLPFHVQFSLQACEVTIDRRYGEDAAAALVFQQTIPGRDVAVDLNL